MDRGRFIDIATLEISTAVGGVDHLPAAVREALAKAAEQLSPIVISSAAFASKLAMEIEEGMNFAGHRFDEMLTPEALKDMPVAVARGLRKAHQRCGRSHVRVL